MLKRYLAKRRIKKFLTVIPRTLARDYGRNREYTKGQVEAAAKKLGYTDHELLCVAVAIYCTSEVAKAFGMDEALVKKYKGYPDRHRIAFGHATAGSNYDITGHND